MTFHLPSGAEIPNKAKAKYLKLLLDELFMCQKQAKCVLKSEETMATRPVHTSNWKQTKADTRNIIPSY
jgi:hypothetical protein